MSENNQEGYQTLGWIINKSEQGLYLVVADDEIQKEIIEVYRQGMVGIYDYRRHPGAYSFRDLHNWIAALPEYKTFLIANLQLAIQSDEDLERLNFSRDMIAGLEKNFIFLITSYGDDRLALGAYDFYSFLKLKIIFHNYDIRKEKRVEEHRLNEDRLIQDIEWKPEEAKQKLKEAYVMLEQAKDERDRARYYESEKLLLNARRIKEKLFGTEHLEVAAVDFELAIVCVEQGKYKEAEELYKKVLTIEEEVLGENHPDTANSYECLAILYQKQGKYNEADEWLKKVLIIREEVLGENHPDTAKSYNNLARLYDEQGKYKESEELYKKRCQK